MYSDEDIARLIGAAKLLPSPLGLRGETYRTFFGLLVVTGMRHSEARQLDRDDVDLTDGILTVRVTKFGKSRLVPLHTSTRDALRRYATLRDRIIPKPKSPSFFLSERGAGLNRWTVYSTFDKLKRQAGLQGRRSPRIHDLRFRHPDYSGNGRQRWAIAGGSRNRGRIGGGIIRASSGRPRRD